MNFIFKGANIEEEIALTERQIAQFERQVIVLKGYILYLEELQPQTTENIEHEDVDSKSGL